MLECLFICLFCVSVLCAGLQIRAFHQKARVSRFLPAHNHFLRLYPSVLLINSKLAAGDRGRTHREGLVTHSKHYKNRAALCSFYLHINTLNPHSKFKNTHQLPTRHTSSKSTAYKQCNIYQTALGQSTSLISFLRLPCRDTRLS